MRARPVRLAGERCNAGIKELQLVEAEDWVGADWVQGGNYGPLPTTMDPHERQAVAVGNSGAGAAAGEGLFARRSFLPGELVSYFGGLHTTTEEMFWSNMTEAEETEAGSYYYNLGVNCPDWWGVSEELVLDIPPSHRSITQYRSTLGHKTNHAFRSQANCEFSVVRHPVQGAIPCLLAIKPISRGQELTVDYLYDMDSAEQWYRDLYHETIRRKPE